ASLVISPTLTCTRPFRNFANGSIAPPIRSFADPCRHFPLTRLRSSSESSGAGCATITYPMIINCVAYQNGRKLADIRVNEISSYIARPDCFVWVGLKDPEPAELAAMQH